LTGNNDQPINSVRACSHPAYLPGRTARPASD
jgi:hypothetical protein